MSDFNHDILRATAANMPGHADLIAMLMAERHALSPRVTKQFWLCVDETRCEIVESPARPFGVFVRARIEIYFTNKHLEQLADDLINGLEDSYRSVLESIR